MTQKGLIGARSALLVTVHPIACGWPDEFSRGLQAPAAPGPIHMELSSASRRRLPREVMGGNLQVQALSVPLPTLPHNGTNEGPICWVAAQLLLTFFLRFVCLVCCICMFVCIREMLIRSTIWASKMLLPCCRMLSISACLCKLENYQCLKI